MPRPVRTPVFHEVTAPGARTLGDLPVETGRTPADYEFRILTVPRGTSTSTVRSALTEQSEYGRWELVRTRLYMGGAKKVWMRRRIIRVTSTLMRDVY